MLMPRTERIEMARRGARSAKDGWRRRITADPRVCGGVPCVAGTRVMVSVILDNIAAGLSPQEIVEHYPTLALEDVRAAAAYAAELAKGHVLAP
jgi:uncharacterized protein (DUF433 family)